MSVLEKINEPEKFEDINKYVMKENKRSENLFYELSKEEQDFVINEAVNIRLEICCEGEIMRKCNLAEWMYVDQFGIGHRDDIDGYVYDWYYDIKNTKYYEEHNGLSRTWIYKVV